MELLVILIPDIHACTFHFKQNLILVIQEHCDIIVIKIISFLHMKHSALDTFSKCPAWMPCMPRR